MADRNQGQPKWQIRRRIIISTLLFCAGAVAYIMFFGADTSLNETIVTGCFSMATLVISGYIFGAVIDDKTNQTAKSVEDLTLAMERDERPEH